MYSNVSRTVYVDPKIGLKLHFKSKCPAEIAKTECKDMQNNLVLDFSLNKLKEKVQIEVKKMLNIDNIP